MKVIKHMTVLLEFRYDKLYKEYNRHLITTGWFLRLVDRLLQYLKNGNACSKYACLVARYYRKILENSFMKNEWHCHCKLYVKHKNKLHYGKPD